MGFDYVILPEDATPNGAVETIDDSSELKSKLDEIYDYDSIPERIPRENVIRQTKFGIASENWIKENEIDAAAFQCWTSIQENFGCATCLTMSMFGEKLLPGACEVDVCGAISMYAISLATGNPAALFDWNNNFAEDRNKCVCTHCSNYPKSFVQNPIEISNLDVLGASLGGDRPLLLCPLYFFLQ